MNNYREIMTVFEVLLLICYFLFCIIGSVLCCFYMFEKVLCKKRYCLFTSYPGQLVIYCFRNRVKMHEPSKNFEDQNFPGVI